jgi:hypothetical protein
MTGIRYQAIITAVVSGTLRIRIDREARDKRLGRGRISRITENNNPFARA